MIYPTEQEFIRQSQQYQLISVVLEMPDKGVTPIGAFEALCQEPNCFLLESKEGGHYSYIGRKPGKLFKAHGQHISIQSGQAIQRFQENPLKALEKFMNLQVAPPPETMPPFLGGAVGYLGYDMVRQVENLPCALEDPIQMPDAHFMLAEEVVIFDHQQKKLYLIISVKCSPVAEKNYQQACFHLENLREALLAFVPPTEKKPPCSNSHGFQSSETKEGFVKKVKQAKEYIRNGEIFQVVLSQRFHVNTGLEPFEAYKILRKTNPSPYLFYLDFGDYQLAGASPELLVKVEADVVETCPIAGTRPRGKTAEEDQELAEQLLNDPKERAEHLMLVDLARNDLGKVSEFGSVLVTEWMEVKRFSHVMHIVSRVQGRRKPAYGMIDCIKACLPAGTLSGAPKVRAMQIIDQLEPEKRGAYGGAVGYLGYHGNMDLCITIRTIIFKDQTAYVQAGAGIVADSVPELEYEETLRKAGAMLETIERKGTVS